MLIELVEERVEEHVQTQRLDPKLRKQIEVMLRDELLSLRRRSDAESHQLRQQKDRLTNERTRLLQAHYAGAVPLDLLKAEQDRIARRLSDIEVKLKAVNVEFDKIEIYLHHALDYAMNCGAAYMPQIPRSVDY